MFYFIDVFVYFHVLVFMALVYFFVVGRMTVDLFCNLGGTSSGCGRVGQMLSQRKSDCIIAFCPMSYCTGSIIIRKNCSNYFSLEAWKA